MEPSTLPKWPIEYRLRTGDVLVNSTGTGTVGRTRLFHESCLGTYPFVVPDSHVSVIRSFELISSDYLYIVLSSEFGQLYFEDNLSGSTNQKELYIGAISELPIPLPPTNEQQRISEQVLILNNSLEIIDKQKTGIERSVDSVKARVLELAIHGQLVSQDPSDEPASEFLKRINPEFAPSHNLHYEEMVPNGWLLLTYNDVADYINGRAFKPEEWESNGWPIIRIQNLNDPYAPYNYSSNSFEKQYQIQKGDLLFAWAASLGVYIWDGQDAWLNQHIFKVMPYSCIDKEYLFFTLSASINDFYQKSHGSGMVHITRKQFVNMPLLLPPINEQKRIINAIKAYYKVLDDIVAGLN